MGNSLIKKVFYVPCSYWKFNYRLVKHPQDKLRLLYVGRLEKIKNLEIVLSAISWLINRKLINKSEIEFTVVGTGSYFEKYKKLIKKLNIEKIVNLKGYISDEILNKLYKKHNIFILPSNPEPIGLVVLEAMYNNLPILCSSRAGASSYVVAKKNGEIFDPNNYIELAKKILFYTNPKIRAIHGKNSLEILKQNYDFKIVGNSLYNLLKQ